MEYMIYKSDELYHHGIKGQKWGIRRYQRKDGSLTNAGKRRLKREQDELRKEAAILKNRQSTKAKIDRLESRRKALDDKKKAFDEEEAKSKTGNNQPAKKSIKDMSDDELARSINRARMEDEYRRLRPEPKPPEKHAFMKQMVNDVVKPAMVNSGKKLLENSMNSVIEKLTKGKVDPNSLEALKKTYEKLDYKQKIDKMLNPDKYLSEEDKTKRADRAYKAEDRAAQMEGYKDAADKARSTRDAAEASRKAAADEAARAANESTSREYYNAQYNSRGGERTDFGSSSSNRSNALSVVNNHNNSPVKSLSTTSVSSGRTYANDYMDFELLDSDGRVIKRWNY